MEGKDNAITDKNFPKKGSDKYLSGSSNNTDFNSHLSRPNTGNS